MLGEHVAEAFARAVAPAGDDDVQAPRAQRPRMRDRGVEHIGVLALPLGREIAAGPSAAVDGVARAGRRLEGREAREGLSGQPLLPLVLAHIEPREGQRLVVRLDGIVGVGSAAGGVVIGNERDALVRRVLRPRVQHERRARDIVEQRIQAFVEERQPMLEADRAAALADRGVKIVVARRRAEFLGVELTEAADQFGRQSRFAHRHEIERAQLPGRALRLGIEGADRIRACRRRNRAGSGPRRRADRDRECRRATRSRRRRAPCWRGRSHCLRASAPDRPSARCCPARPRKRPRR